MNTREFKCAKILTDLIENEGLVEYYSNKFIW